MSKHAEHIPSRAHLFHRTTMLVGRPAMDRINVARVAVFGVGGVGSWTAEALVRSGFERLTILDSDVICATNVNRQVQATALNAGKSKVDELKRRLLEINPHATIDTLWMPYNADTCQQVDLRSFDYVIDSIDSLKNKILLIEESLKAGVKLFSSMGAGAKLDPTRIRVAPLSESSVCPLARMVRKRLGRRGVPRDFLCVYSDEMPLDPATGTFCGSAECACPKTVPANGGPAEKPEWCARKSRINGTLVHVTAAFGFALAGLVIQDIMKVAAPPMK